MISASLVHKVGVRDAVASSLPGPLTSVSLKERAAKLGIVPSEPLEGSGQLPGRGSDCSAWPRRSVPSGCGASSGSQGLQPGWAKQEFEEPRPQPLLRPTLAPSQRSSWRGRAGGTGAGVKAETSHGTAPVSQRVKTELELKREEEKDMRRQEAAARDAACKAICVIKHGLRERSKTAASSDFVPKDWDKAFKPHLGSYMLFLLSRPDQFQVAEGLLPGTFTVQNLAGNVTVNAPAWKSQRAGDAPGIGCVKPELPCEAPPRGRQTTGPRERLDKDARACGEVVRWCGGFGWIRPLAPVEHPAAAKHSGDVFVHSSDVIGAWKLEPGTAVDFVIYADRSGLGAEECRISQVPGRAAWSRGAPKGGKGASLAGGKGKVPAAPMALPGALAGHRGRERSPRRQFKTEGSAESSSPALPVLALRPLAPLRLSTPLAPASPSGFGAKVEAREEGDVLGVPEEEGNEEDGVEAMGFVVDGEDEDMEEPGEPEDLESLGFTLDGEATAPDAGAERAERACGDGIGETAESSAAGFDVWTLLTAEDEDPNGAAKTIVKRLRI